MLPTLTIDYWLCRSWLLPFFLWQEFEGSNCSLRKAHTIKLTVVSYLCIFCPSKIMPVSLTNGRISGIVSLCFNSSLFPSWRGYYSFMLCCLPDRLEAKSTLFWPGCVSLCTRHNINNMWWSKEYQHQGTEMFVQRSFYGDFHTAS